MILIAHPVPIVATTKPSLGLAASGLLGVDTSERAEDLLFPKAINTVVPGIVDNSSGHDSSLSCMGGKGGLFDDVDQLEAENTERERVRLQLVAKEEEARQAAAATIAQEEAERARQAAAAQQQQQLIFEQQERIKREQLDNVYYTQSLQDQMQSIHLGTAGGFPQGQQQQQMTPHLMIQQQQQQQQYNNQQMMMNNGYQSSGVGIPPQQQQQSQLIIDPPVKKISMDLYRDPEPIPGVATSNNGISQQPNNTMTPRFYQPDQPGNFAAGLHNATPQGMMQQSQQFQQNQQNQQIRSPERGVGGAGMFNNPGHQMQQQQQLLMQQHQQQYLPTPTSPPATITDPLYIRVLISDPILVQSDSSFFGVRQPPHWNYQITTELTPANGGGGIWIVRRRFRHVVSLEDRLREDCPGAILPPRYVLFYCCCCCLVFLPLQ
jgi:hypothetical protein